MHEAETRALRDRLHDAQRRLSHLEAEILRLKPLLLMQPYSKGKYRRHDHGHPSSRHAPQTQDKSEPTKDKGKGREIEPHPQQEHSRSLGNILEDQEHRAGPSESHASSSHHHNRRRSRERHATTSKSSKRRSVNRHTPLSSDAYAEHLLLAARRVGRQRAAHVSGLMQHAEREKELLNKEQQRTRDMREQERLERERLEQMAMGNSAQPYYRSDGTPQRNPALQHTPTPKKQIHYGPSTSMTPIVFVHQSPPVPAPNYNTPHSTSNGASRGQQMAQANNPPTPLGFLLDAARMMDDGAGRKANGKGRAIEEPESPMPKRRRVSGAGSARSHNNDTARPIPARDRVRSALDVLAAEAAAAFDDPEQSDRRAAAVAAKGTSNGNHSTNQNYRQGQQIDSGQSAPPPAMPVASTSSGRTRTRGRAPQPAFPSSSTAASSTHAAASSSSGRPLRNAVKRHSVLSPDVEPPPLKSTAAKRGTSRPRGRPRTSVNKARGGAPPETAEPRVISPAQTRVIAPPQLSSVTEREYTPTEVASNGSNRSDIQMEGEEFPSSVPPVAGDAKEDTESMKIGQRSRSPEARRPSQPLRKSIEVHEDRADNLSTVKLEAKFPPSLPVHESKPYVVESDIAVSSNSASTSAQAFTHRAVASNATPLVTPLSASVLDMEMKQSAADDDGTDKDADADVDEDEDADAETDIGEDQDAEGEQEEDVDGEAKDIPPRSKSPPPPGPPPPGGPPPGNDGNEPDADADADAEGDMDLEEGDENVPNGGQSYASGVQHSEMTRNTGVHGHVQDGPLEATTAPMKRNYLSALNGKSWIAYGLNGVLAKRSDRCGLRGEGAQVISLEKSSGVPIVKWGKVDIFLPVCF
ncbi:hypothetical protein BDN70DRAFT_88728 [Pholiota conissans]|uniref:Uncharacterized protein n=1 Tax=Pholiota conissans TaxID=109636 RepID=A0A9P6CYU7_9AGAR|nr:hypothetical protein BDN70DRAFT_88728 [Pholiota conissans]